MIDRHDEDGKAYIAYYRRDHTTGFIWTGNSSDPVQVTREMSEPVIDTFEVAIDQDQSTEAVLVRFKAACDRFLEHGKVSDTLYAEAEAAYDRHDQEWFNNQSTEDLVAMWALCCNIHTMPSWDDEVYDALAARGHFEEV